MNNCYPGYDNNEYDEFFNNVFVKFVKESFPNDKEVSFQYFDQPEYYAYTVMIKNKEKFYYLFLLFEEKFKEPSEYHSVCGYTEYTYKLKRPIGY